MVTTYETNNSSVAYDGVEPPESMTTDLQSVPLPLRYNTPCVFILADFIVACQLVAGAGFEPALSGI
jgi:hypothetical protein